MRRIEMVAPGASWMPIGELSRRTGVSSDLLRKWERRYGVLVPRRTDGNQRLYSQVDEARVRLMLRHVRGGVQPAQAAELAIAARFRIATGGGSTATLDDTGEVRARMLRALEGYDETGAEQVLEKLQSSTSATNVIRDVFLPMLRELGDRWADGHVNVAQEHFASGFIHGRLLGLARGWDRGLGQRAVLACPESEQHTFGLIAFGIALHQLGWRITYLGADTPIPLVGQAAVSVSPRLIVLSAVVPERLASAFDQLRELSVHWSLALAGAGASPGAAAACNAMYLSKDPVTAAGEVLA